MFGNLAEHLRRDILYGQLWEHLLSSLGNVSRASKNKRKWSNWLWHHAEWDLVATIPNCLTSHRWITVIVGGSNVHEGCMMSQSQKTQSNAMQDVHHASHSGIFAKSHLSWSSPVNNSFIVYKSDFLRKLLKIIYNTFLKIKYNSKPSPK